MPSLSLDKPALLQIEAAWIVLLPNERHKVYGQTDKPLTKELHRRLMRAHLMPLVNQQIFHGAN